MTDGNPSNKILQSGNVTPGHLSTWVTDGVIQDGGSTFSANLQPGTTVITGGVNNKILYDNNQVLAEGTVGAGLSFSGGVLSNTGIGLAIGTSPITGGTTNKIIYDNAGIVGEATVGAGLNFAAGVLTNPGSAGVFNVQVYGAVGNGVTDDTAAINAAIAAFNSAGAGELLFPATANWYQVTGALTTITAHGLVSGQGGGNYWDSVHDVSGPYVSSCVKCNSNSVAVFSVNSGQLTFNNLAIICNASSTAVAGSKGITTTFAQLDPTVNFFNLYVAEFYINVEVNVGAGWVMESCILNHPVNIGLSITNTVNADAGDWCVMNCTFNARSGSSATGLKQVNSGGGKIANCKFNGEGTFGFVDCCNINLTLTSDFLLTNCSMENFLNHALNCTNLGNAMISNLQTIGGGSTGRIIYVNNCATSCFVNLMMNEPSVGCYMFRFDSGANQISINNVALLGGACKGLVDPNGSIPAWNEDYQLYAPADVHVTNATMVTATGLSAVLQTLAGASAVPAVAYNFEATLFFTCAAAGGIQCQMTASGGLNTTTCIYAGYIIDSDGNGIKGNTQATSLGSVVASSTLTGTAGIVKIEGTIIPGTSAGTLSVQFAKNTATGVDTVVLKGSKMSIKRMPMSPQ